VTLYIREAMDTVDYKSFPKKELIEMLENADKRYADKIEELEMMVQNLQNKLKSEERKTHFASQEYNRLKRILSILIE
jgi:hypothetical protein